MEGLDALRWGATATGCRAALTVLAMLVGVLRGESAGDVRTLTAVGAPARVRRLVTATTAGVLGLARRRAGDGRRLPRARRGLRRRAGRWARCPSSTSSP